ALDGDAPNSPFATAFLKNLKVPKLDVRRLFDLVRDDVMEMTGRRQQPFAYSSVSGREEFYFLTTPVGLTPTTPQISDPIVPGQQEPTAPTARLKIPDRIEPGRPQTPATPAPGTQAGEQQRLAALRARYSTLMNQGHTDINNGDYDRAIAAFSDALRLDPKGAPTFTNRGVAYERKGDMDRAI